MIHLLLLKYVPLLRMFIYISAYSSLTIKFVVNTIHSLNERNTVPRKLVPINLHLINRAFILLSDVTTNQPRISVYYQSKYT